MSEHRPLLKSASLISAFTILSRILGYIRDSRVAFLLGAGTAADAYTTAYRIPNLIRRLVAEGAVSAAFIPVFTRYLAEKKEKDAWEFANTMLTVITMFLTALTVMGIVFSPLLVRLFASGFGDTPGKLELTAGLNRIMFPYIFLISISAFAMGVLNSFHRFGAPAFSPVVLNLTMITFSFLGGLFGDVTRTLAVGVVVGGLMQLAIQLPPLLNSGWKLQLKLDFSHPGVRTVAKLMVPVIFGVGIVQINVLVDTQFASYLEEGSVTAIYIADRVMELVLGGYAVAVSTVILPLLSRQAALRQMGELKTTLNFAARIILFITLPATVGLVILRQEIIEVLFQHGDFDAASTALTAWALPFFAIGLSAFSMVKIIVPAFYALEDTRTPVKIAFVAMFLNIGLNFLFIRPLRNGGPALATSVSAFFNSFALLTIFHRRYGSFGVGEIVQSIVKFAIASVALGAVAYTVIHWPGFYTGGMAQRAVALAVSIAAGTASYFSASSLLSTRELAELRAVRRARPGALL
ncbi:MAG: murein biosynthesis integral membrane protein MurJ [Acidobacteria bacterium]|nr:MAG: murein biosynthesis integral membrane protein MurJ [Acidobacteriota bacterium]